MDVWGGEKRLKSVPFLFIFEQRFYCREKQEVEKCPF